MNDEPEIPLAVKRAGFRKFAEGVASVARYWRRLNRQPEFVAAHST